MILYLLNVSFLSNNSSVVHTTYNKEDRQGGREREEREKGLVGMCQLYTQKAQEVYHRYMATFNI